MAEKSANIHFLQQQQNLLQSIDRALTGIDQYFAQAHGYRATTWKLHFSFFWDALQRQMGWEGRRSRRLRWMQSLFPSLNPTFIGESPVWKNPQAFQGYPAEAAHYEMPYGFVLNSSGVDSWYMPGTGHYAGELSETFLFLKLFQAVDWFVDVGANIGFYTLMAGAQSSAQILSCEPSSWTYKRLAEAVKLNSFAERVTLLNIALGQTPGRADLHARDMGSGGESLLPMPKVERPEGREQVEVRTLDALREEFNLHQKKVLIKIDVEGFEHSVLAGGLAWRRSQMQPIFLFEAWPEAPVSPRRIIHKLENDGYQVWAIQYPQPHAPSVVIKKPGLRAGRGTGNFLALPPWAAAKIPELQEPLDMRLFSAAEKLYAAQVFLENYLAALHRH